MPTEPEYLPYLRAHNLPCDHNFLIVQKRASFLVRTALTSVWRNFAEPSYLLVVTTDGLYLRKLDRAMAHGDWSIAPSFIDRASLEAFSVEDHFDEHWLKVTVGGVTTTYYLQKQYYFKVAYISENYAHLAAGNFYGLV